MKTRLGLVAVPGLILSWFLTAAPGQEAGGFDLARRLGCFACHSWQESGGGQASRLDGVGSRLTPGDLQKILTYPRQLHPGAKMPSYAYLRPGEMKALVDFLRSLRGGPGERSSPALPSNSPPHPR